MPGEPSGESDFDVFNVNWPRRGFEAGGLRFFFINTAPENGTHGFTDMLFPGEGANANELSLPVPVGPRPATWWESTLTATSAGLQGTGFHWYKHEVWKANWTRGELATKQKFNSNDHTSYRRVE